MPRKKYSAPNLTKALSQMADKPRRTKRQARGMDTKQRSMRSLDKLRRRVTYMLWTAAMRCDA